MSSWDSKAADDLWMEACGKDRWLGTMPTLEQDIRRVSDADLWQLRTAASKSFVQYVRQRLSLQLASSGAAGNEARSPHGRCIGRLRLYRGGVSGSPTDGLHDPRVAVP